jgi:hypothetical protein
MKENTKILEKESNPTRESEAGINILLSKGGWLLFCTLTDLP